EESPLLSPESKKAIAGVLSEIASAAQLAPLGKAEILEILEKIRDCHGRAYGWDPAPSAAEILKVTEKHGYLLRTRIRTAVELLDQHYQYGSADEISVGELGQASFDGDDGPPSLDAFM
ncbi:MAG: ATP-binding protein, partial [Oscillospiraceae bacterium]|nr:ATP-binding protein [Oscillospiraceae bacterium]